MRVAEQQIAVARKVNLIELAGRFITLTRVSATEYHGPCPRCGGQDRFVCKADGWFCRQCRPIHPRHGWHSAIDFVMWHLGYRFADAVAYLTGTPPEGLMEPTRSQTLTRPHAAHRKPRQSDNWRTAALRLVEEARHALFTGADARGAHYLERRGLQPHVWMQFSLGYTRHYCHESRREEPAIVLPWVSKEGVVAVRFRFLSPPGKTKIVSLRGSEFSGVLFGRQGLLGHAESRRTLILCEGELNALSIWQIAHETNLDVLSVGSESAKLTPALINYARRFLRVIVWMDKPEIGRELQAQIPGACSVSSPEGQDANDLLQQGSLGHFLTAVRFKAAQSEEERAKLLWDLWDAANGMQGIDSGTANAFRKLCELRGRDFDLVEVEPGRWITRRQVGEGKHG